MTKINYKSDFDFILRLKDCADPKKTVPFPEGDFDARFWTSNKANAYTASCRDGVYTNCFRTEDGGMHFVFDDHRMGKGTLHWEPHFELPNDIYPDNMQDLYRKAALDIELVDGDGDCPTTAELEAMLPYIKGEPFTFEDFTPEQIAELQRPATEAASSVLKLEKNVETAEKKRIADEQSRQEAEQARIGAEETRESNESVRQENEQKREKAETDRQKAEKERAEEFASWENEIDSKAERSELSNVLAEEPLTPDNFPDINTYTREELKKDLFIDMWNEAWGEYGGYDPVNAPDAEHPFMGNELWFTYNEAMEIWRMSYHHCLPVVSISVGTAKVYPPYAFGGCQNFCRTYLPVMLNANYEVVADYMFASNNMVETILILDNGSAVVFFSSSKSIFRGCVKLRKIISKLYFKQYIISSDSEFDGCSSLENVDITFYIGGRSLSFAQSARLSLDSLKKMVLQARWLPSDSSHTSTSTITVHPDVFAKLTDETNTEWHALLALAAEKNISFATT